MKRTSKYFVLGILLVMGISLGYALISSTLTINGTASVKSNTFSVIWSKVEDETITGSVGKEIVSPATISADKTTINFSVKLDKPGDAYQFKAYRKNAGSIDATLDSTNPVEVIGMYDLGTTTLKYDKIFLSILDPTQTSNPNTNIYHNLTLAPDLLANKENYVVVKLEYTDDLEASDLLAEDLTLDLSIKLNYVQKK